MKKENKDKTCEKALLLVLSSKTYSERERRR